MNNAPVKDGQCQEVQNKNQEMGLISLIQGFSVQDGPGIRTTVFMKGCPLECWWCQNPESMKPYPELVVRDSKCQMCGNCADSCPVDAIYIDPEKGIKIDRSKCNRCFECVASCPTGALERVGDYMTVKEVMAEIEKDELFHSKSNGGVTLSGGEPLFQANFIMLLLQACKQRGLNTALDTSGYAPWKTFERVLNYVNLVLYDLKHTDPKIHKKAVGKSNDLILSNLRKIPPDKRIWLRIPLLSGFNDTEDNLKGVGELGREIEVEKVSILPFNKLGEGKYKQLDRVYPIGEIKTPTKEQVREIQKFLEGFGLQVTIGE